jgi:hypothetical protein
MFGPHLCQWIQTGALLQSMYLSLHFPCVNMPPPFFCLDLSTSALDAIRNIRVPGLLLNTVM